MVLSFQLFLIVAVAIYFIIVLMMLKTGKFSVKFSLLWIVCGFFMILFALFPQIVFDASAIIGISNPVNAIFLLFGVFTIVMLLALTSIVSSLSVKNLKLIQTIGLLEERIRKLEEEQKQGE